MEQKNHALIIGASGLIGWSVVNQLLWSYPTEGTFSKVTALVNRPLDLEKCFWPKATLPAPELKLVSSVDLLCTDEEFKATLKEKVTDAASITHVYYFGKLKGRLSHDRNAHVNKLLRRTRILSKKSRSTSA
jgi:hypothetical protein